MDAGYQGDKLANSYEELPHHLQLEAKRFTLKQLFVKGSSHTLYL